MLPWEAKMKMLAPAKGKEILLSKSWTKVLLGISTVIDTGNWENFVMQASFCFAFPLTMQYELVFVTT